MLLKELKVERKKKLKSCDHFDSTTLICTRRKLPLVTHRSGRCSFRAKVAWRNVLRNGKFFGECHSRKVCKKAEQNQAIFASANDKYRILAVKL